MCPSQALQWCVNASEQLIALGTIIIHASLRDTTPCNHSCLVLKCFNLPHPLRSVMPLAAELSLRIRKFTLFPKSYIMSRAPIPSQPALTVALSSASPTDNATVACVLLQCAKQCLPIVTTPPDVDFLVLTHPAQSLPLHTVNMLHGSRHLNTYINLGAPHK